MATYSSNLNLKKPGYSDPADIADINNNMDLIDTAVDNNSGSMADKYDETSTYNAGERCVHDNKLYKAKIDISTPETWNAAHWDEVKISDEIDDTNQAVAKLSEGMTYVVNGNTSIESTTIPVGSYVRLVNSTITGRSDGIYTVATAIPVNTAIDGTYFNETAPIPGGVSNALNSKLLIHNGMSGTGFSETQIAANSSFTALYDGFYLFSLVGSGSSSAMLYVDANRTLPIAGGSSQGQWYLLPLKAGTTLYTRNAGSYYLYNITFI